MPHRFAIVLACLTATAASAQYQLYWGDLHGHTALSDGQGTPREYFTHARDAAKLDFVILTDHDFSYRSPEQLPRESWHLIQETADAFNADTKFVAIAGYEWSSQPGYWAENANGASTALFAGKPRHYNHKNVYFPSRVECLFSARDSNYNSPDLLAAAVAKVGGLIHNNHPSDDEPDQFHYTAEHAAIIANTELWPDVGFDKGKRYTPNTVQTVRKFLDRGGRTGFVGGSDSHDGKPYARTAVFATNLTRAGIFDALRHRRTYVITRARIGLNFRINDHLMGEEIEVSDKPRIQVDVKGTAHIDEIALIRDGQTIHILTNQSENTSFTYIDETFQPSSYYYLHVTQSDTDEHGNHSQAWPSPIWVRKRQ